MHFVYLFTGESTLRRRSAENQMKEIRAQSKARLGDIRLDGEELELRELLSHLKISPLFEDGKIILIHNADEFKDQEPLVEILNKSLPPHVYLILECEKLDKRSKLYKTIEKKGLAQELSKPDRRTLPGIVRELLKEKNVRVTAEGFRYLVSAVEPDVGRLEREIEKLACYPHKGELDVEELKGLVFSDQSGNIFEFLDLVGERKLAVLKYLRRLLESGEDPMKLFFMIASQIRSLLSVKSLIATGQSDDEIAQELGRYAWMINKQRRMVSQFTEAELIELIHRLQREDIAIKQGEREPHEALFEILLRITVPKHVLQA
ncbi:DNA polymerase III subunit delta [Candidatus Acetothermia bacterium]|nr:DNA polymerase III subunit delta [Candidatus Acetothermia bacterium]